MFTKSQVILFFLLILCFNYCKANHHCQSKCHGDSANDKNINISMSNVTVSYVTNCCDKTDNEHHEGYTTSGQQLYNNHFSASSLKCFSYRVQSRNQTHIGLFSNSNPLKTNPWIEIVVGGFPTPEGNGNVFRKNGPDVSGTYSSRQNSLNQYEYRGFWVSWVGGHIKVGYRGQQPFMSWQDPNPFQINYVGIETCCGTIGHYIVEEPKCPGINI